MKTLIFSLLFSLQALALDYGIDRLGDPSVARHLDGKKLAVLTHAAARSKTGVHLIDTLFASYHLTKIYAPEHGLRTMADEWVNDGVDEATGLPVISLYKRGSKAPPPESLVGVDAVVVDLQDVGVRYYTYFSTIAEVMKACAAAGVEVILLDRPNLLGGKILEGKVLDPELVGGFTAYHTVPTRHGMTLGELATMINAENKMGVKLTVIEAAGWARERVVLNLDREWLPPSPALVDPSQVGLYALWGTLESVNLAVGRGRTNELAFHVIGAPWISESESIQLANELNNFFHLKALSFVPFSWDVTRAKYIGKRANGVKMIWDGSEVRTDELTYKIAQFLVQRYPKEIGAEYLSPSSFGSRKMVEAIKTGVPWSQYVVTIDAELAAFRKRRDPFLLYSESQTPR